MFTPPKCEDGDDVEDVENVEDVEGGEGGESFISLSSSRVISILFSLLKSDHFFHFSKQN